MSHIMIEYDITQYNVIYYYSGTVGFHNYNLRIFNLKVSNPNKLIVDVFVDTMSDFNVPGSRPKKHDDISEIDRESGVLAGTMCMHVYVI